MSTRWKKEQGAALTAPCSWGRDPNSCSANYCRILGPLQPPSSASIGDPLPVQHDREGSHTVENVYRHLSPEYPGSYHSHKPDQIFDSLGCGPHRKGRDPPRLRATRVDVSDRAATAEAELARRGV